MELESDSESEAPGQKHLSGERKSEGQGEEICNAPVEKGSSWVVRKHLERRLDDCDSISMSGIGTSTSPLRIFK